MATLATAVAEVRTGGSATNGGGYDPGISGAGTDYSQQNAAQLAVTDGAITAGTATLTSTTGGFTSAMIGNAVYISSDPTLWFFITAVASSNSCTVDKNAVTGGTGLTVNVGGAFAKLPDVIGSTAKAIPGNVIFWKSGTYTISSTWTVSMPGTTSAEVKVIGYDTNRSDGNTDSGPLLTSATNSVNLITLNASGRLKFYNFNASHTAGTRGNAFVIGNNGTTSNLVVERAVFDGMDSVWDPLSTFSGTHNTVWVGCEAKNGSSVQFELKGGSNIDVHRFHYCYIHDNTGVVIQVGTSNTTIHLTGNIFDSNSTHVLDVPSSFGPDGILYANGNTVYGNGGSFVRMSGTNSGDAQIMEWVNNVIYSNSGYAITLGTATAENKSRNFINRGNAYGSNSSGNFNNFPAGVDNITLTADPFTNAAGGDFSLNNTAGGGAAIRGKAYPLTLAGQTNHRDIGALQHQASGGGGLMVHPGMRGGFRG